MTQMSLFDGGPAVVAHPEPATLRGMPVSNVTAPAGPTGQGWRDRTYWLRHASDTDLLQTDVPLSRAEEAFLLRRETQEDYQYDHR